MAGPARQDWVAATATLSSSRAWARLEPGFRADLQAGRLDSAWAALSDSALAHLEGRTGTAGTQRGAPGATLRHDVPAPVDWQGYAEAAATHRQAAVIRACRSALLAWPDGLAHGGRRKRPLALAAATIGPNCWPRPTKTGKSWPRQLLPFPRNRRRPVLRLDASGVTHGTSSSQPTSHGTAAESSDGASSRPCKSHRPSSVLQTGCEAARQPAELATAGPAWQARGKSRSLRNGSLDLGNPCGSYQPARNPRPSAHRRRGHGRGDLGAPAWKGARPWLLDSGELRSAYGLRTTSKDLRPSSTRWNASGRGQRGWPRPTSFSCPSPAVPESRLCSGGLSPCSR